MKNESKFKKIQVLLIDDYPSFALTKVGNINLYSELSLQPNQFEKEIPYIDDVTVERTEIDNLCILEPDSVKVQKEQIPFSKYFELKWLRNSDDIQLFRKLCQNVEEEYSAARLGGSDGFVPEVVLFDYALTGHEDKSFPNESEDMAILERSVPIYSLKKILSKKNGINKEYDIEPVNLSVFEIEKGLNSDNIGCVGGVLTVSYFRNHPCIGIAITRKSDEHLKGQEAIFIEGLVKEPHQYDFSLRGNTKNLSWEFLLKRAANNLRMRIKILIHSSKIIPSLSQLIELAGGEMTERVFSFNSIYGDRILPLDGLFIDVTQEQRNEKIIVYAQEILEVHLLNANSSLAKNSVLKDALIFAESLFTKYDMKPTMLKRIRFSQLLNLERQCIITTDQATELVKLKDDYGIKTSNNTEINDGYDLRYFKGENECLVKRYAALFVMTKVYVRFKKFKNKNENLPCYKGEEYLFEKPSKQDYMLALYPNAKDPLILPLHYKSDSLDKNFKRDTRLLETDIEGNETGLSLAQILKNKTNHGLSKGERILIQSYATGLGLSKKDWAEWFL